MSGSGAPIRVDQGDVDGYAIGESGSGGAIKHLIERSTGSEVLLGLYRLEPGQGTSFDLPGRNGAEEIY